MFYRLQLKHGDSPRGAKILPYALEVADASPQIYEDSAATKMGTTQARQVKSTNDGHGPLLHGVNTTKRSSPVHKQMKENKLV